MLWQLLPLVLLSLTACADLRRLLPPPQEARSPGHGAISPKDRSAPDTSKKEPFNRDRCLRERQVLESQIAELRRSEALLARVKEERYGPRSSPPRWNEDQESRFRPEDRDADWQNYLKAREEWHRQEGGRQSRWQADHARRLDEAQVRLDRTARSLREQHPDLFTTPGSIEFNPAVVRRLRDCKG